jgi:hypothetical protein
MRPAPAALSDQPTLELVAKISANDHTALEHLIKARKLPMTTDALSLPPERGDSIRTAPIPTYGLLPVHAAAFYDAVECLVLLQPPGAGDVDQMTELVYLVFLEFFSIKLYTPLHYACANGALDCATYLLDEGADPNRTVPRVLRVFSHMTLHCLLPLLRATGH